MYIISDEQWAHESNGQMRNLRILLIELCNALICKYFNCPQVGEAPPPPSPPQQQHSNDAKRAQRGESTDSGIAASTSPLSTSSNPAPAAVVATRAVPTFKDFILNAVHRTRTPLNAIALALMYVSRLRSMNPHCAGTEVTPHRVMLSAVMLACKVLYDDTYSNKTWVHVSQGMFNLEEINRMEWEFLEYLRFRLMATRTEWLDYLCDLDVRLCAFVSSSRSAYFTAFDHITEAQHSIHNPSIKRERIFMAVDGPHAVSVTRETTKISTEPDTLRLSSAQIFQLSQISFNTSKSQPDILDFETPLASSRKYSATSHHPTQHALPSSARSSNIVVIGHPNVRTDEMSGADLNDRPATSTTAIKVAATSTAAVPSKLPYGHASPYGPQKHYQQSHEHSNVYQPQRDAVVSATAGFWKNGMPPGYQLSGVQYIHHPLSQYRGAPQNSIAGNAGIAAAAAATAHVPKLGAPQLRLPEYSPSDSDCLSQISEEDRSESNLDCMADQQYLAQEYTQQYASQFQPFFGAALAANQAQRSQALAHMNP